MAHPAASIKSLYSGVGNFTDSDYNETASLKHPRAFDDSPSVATPSYTSSAYDEARADPYLRTPANQRAQQSSTPQDSMDWYDNRSNGTNLLLLSDYSDYQHSLIPARAYPSDLDQLEVCPSENISRPQSRNSTTSCLSTTATKDGIEGKRLSRHAPKALFGNLMGHKPPRLALPLREKPLKSDLDDAGFPPILILEKVQLMNTETLEK